MTLATPTPAGPKTHTKAYIRYVVFALFITNALNYLDRFTLAVLAPYIKRDMDLSDAQIGLLIGLAFSLFYAVCALPIGRMADRGNRRNIIVGTLTIWSTMTALCGFAQNYLHLFIARMGVGVGEAGGLPTAQSMLCDYVGAERRPVVFAIQNFGPVVGLMLGLSVAAWLGVAVGWRYTFIILGGVSLAWALVVGLTLKEPRRGDQDPDFVDQSQERLTATLRTLANSRLFCLLLLYQVTLACVSAGVTQWLPSFYQRTWAVDSVELGWKLAVTMGVGDGTGLFLGGATAVWLSKRGARLPFFACAVAIAVAFPVTVLALLSPSLTQSLVLLGVMGVLTNIPGGFVLATLYGSVGPDIRATAGAVVIFCQAAIGYSLGPLIVGLISDTLSAELGAESLRYAMIAPSSGLLVMSLLLLAASHSLKLERP